MKVSTEYLKTLPQHARNNVARRLRRRVGPIGIMLKEQIMYNSPKIGVAVGHDPIAELNIPHKLDMKEWDWGYVRFIKSQMELLLGRDYLCLFPYGLVVDGVTPPLKNGKQVEYKIRYNRLTDPVGRVTITWEHGKIVGVSGVMMGVYVLLHQVGYTGP